jgi:hypothetical protein
VAFVRRGCKPREAFRCGEENDATPGGAQSAEEGARANGGGRTYGMTLYPDARDGAGRRARMAPRTRGGLEGDARDARAFDIDARGGASARTDDETDDDAGSGRSTKSLGTTRRPSEGWIIQSCGTS